MVVGEEGRRSSLELGLHAPFPVLPLEFAQPHPLGDGQRWFLVGVLGSVLVALVSCTGSKQYMS